MSTDLEQAVRVFEKAKRILFLTGAGMSADSGIPTFRDRDGFWRNFPVYQRSGLRPEQLATATEFMRCPERSWGFYEWRRRNAARNHPHAGYAAINAMLERYDGFVQTTNTDGYHLRSGTPVDRVYEIHGSMWRLQCLDGHAGLVWDNAQVTLCDLDEQTMLVTAESIPRFQEHELRPNILMFEDYWYVSNTDQMYNLGRFGEQSVDTVLLIGSDCGVPTNVRCAAVHQRRGARVICINPSPDSCGDYLKPDVHLLAKAEEGLVQIADLLGVAVSLHPAGVMTPSITEFRGQYAFLSNFYPSEVLLDGERYPTVEHAFQAAKTFTSQERTAIRLAPTPMKAKRLGRKVALRDDWEQVKLDIMADLLRQKFQDPALRSLLLETGSAEFIEGNTWKDRIWGCVWIDNQWVGENHLGKLLMSIRREIVELRPD